MQPAVRERPALLVVEAVPEGGVVFQVLVVPVFTVGADEMVCALVADLSLAVAALHNVVTEFLKQGGVGIGNDDIKDAEDGNIDSDEISVSKANDLHLSIYNDVVRAVLECNAADMQAVAMGETEVASRVRRSFHAEIEAEVEAERRRTETLAKDEALRAVRLKRKREILAASTQAGVTEMIDPASCRRTPHSQAARKVGFSSSDSESDVEKCIARAVAMPAVPLSPENLSVLPPADAVVVVPKKNCDDIHTSPPGSTSIAPLEPADTAHVNANEDGSSPPLSAPVFSQLPNPVQGQSQALPETRMKKKRVKKVRRLV
jgi:hypothetical protein